MESVCSKCGLPKALCICETLAKEQEKITVSDVKRRFGKVTTTVSGLTSGVDPKTVLRQLKQSLACGGTLKDGVIELQGAHKQKVKAILIRLGFSEDQIQVQ